VRCCAAPLINHSPEILRLTVLIRLTSALLSLNGYGRPTANSVYSLKKRISGPTVLAYFDTKCKTLLTCDTPDVGLGARFSQIENVKYAIAFEHYISY
jgi:hypothetical protein